MQLSQYVHPAVKWFGFDDYQNCHPVEIGSFAFPKLNLPYLVRVWLSGTRWLVNENWVYRYSVRYQILDGKKILTDQRGLDNITCVGDVLKSAYRWLANNALLR